MLTASLEFRKKIRSLTRDISKNEMKQWVKILAPLNRKVRVLEIGSGRGGKTDFLRSQGFSDILSVEKNEFQVEECRSRGLNVVTPEVFANDYGEEKFDFLILSHIIEHFDFEDLVSFIDGYLAYLKPGAMVLIATPLLHFHFWHDLDHRKPYYPQGIKNFYSGEDEQVSFTSEYILKLKDVRFRRSPFRIKNSRNLMLKRNDIPELLFNMISAILFRASFSVLGYKTGWVGLYKLQS